MNRDQPEPDPNQTIRHRYPHSQPMPSQGPPESPYTQRLPYTPDMLPDVPLYEAKPARSGWWWVIVAGGLVLLIAAIAVVAILFVRGGGAATGSRALQAETVTLG
ncbi:hypothetical protein SAMN05444920_13076 [Nonomuraea solani]|uniref:Uncharacterized protein n=2 Tax=Nonomuraea solani TaxID=1144553 RepID=A0A1H6EYJ2_9ACTN|nr:hypothetical protein SAMN05444920_13076 [Nonomuraea solani]